jgi:uncharacterized protein (UPF0332 family)
VVGDDPSTALSAAYYAILYALRAALSERGIATRTHRGAWQEFRTAFVQPGAFDRELAAAAHRIQPEREQVDYDAWEASPEEARGVIAVAERFVDAVQSMFA